MTTYVTPIGVAVAARGTWLPGTYADERSASYAQRFTPDTLTTLRDRVGPDGLITYAMLQNAKHDDDALRKMRQTALRLAFSGRM
jgi:hypothetical protein